MSVPPGGAPTGGAPGPGWYPDPSGSGQLRWWDGADWTAHLSGPGQASGPAYVSGPPVPVQQAARPPRPNISESTPVYNAFIWLIVALPIIPLIIVLFWNPVLRFTTTSTGRLRTADASSIFSLPYFLLISSAFVITAVSVLMAYLDWQKLGKDGVVRPFHWAWVFLGRDIYVVGRSIIVNQVAPRRGLAPVWASLGMAVLAVAIVSIKVSAMLASIYSQLPTM